MPNDVHPLSDRYQMEKASHRLADGAFLLRWRQLLQDSESPERIFQSPEFFDFMLNGGAGEQGAELIAITERSSGELVGVIPVRVSLHSFDFKLGRRLCASLPIHSVVLLGSVPLLPAEPVLLDQLFRFLLAEFPLCQAISLTALPADTSLWRCLSTASQFARNYQLHLLNDWRDCHQIPLPADFAAYMRQFSAKRRYNLIRQLRLLREHGKGRLDLHCIEKPEQVERLSEALRRLTSPRQRNQLLSDAVLREFARHGLLLCYVMECGGEPCALMLGLCSSATLYLYNIFHDSALDNLSAGTAILQMAIEDLCERRHFRAIDLGYGSPAHSCQSTNVTAQRAHVLLLRPSLKNRVICRLHRGFCSLVAWAKRRAG
jgi:CelD/BcsL family acetyltransferase involved in cellulose biosynthesis